MVKRKSSTKPMLLTGLLIMILLSSRLLIFAKEPTPSKTIQYDMGNGGILKFDPATGTITTCNLIEDTDLIIPAAINGITVTHIGDGAFMDGFLGSNIGATADKSGQTATYTGNLEDYHGSGMIHVKSIRLPDTHYTSRAHVR